VEQTHRRRVEGKMFSRLIHLETKNHVQTYLFAIIREEQAEEDVSDRDNKKILARRSKYFPLEWILEVFEQS
jgi:hypothetical protein